MHLTPEQIEQSRLARERGDRRVYLQMTPDQKEEYREAVAEEMAGKEANVARIRKIMASAEQPGFFGDIRRAILLSRSSKHDLAAKIGVEQQVLADFQLGEGELPPAALDRLLQALRLRLMQEIPR
jgi:hypothetical protein